MQPEEFGLVLGIFVALGGAFAAAVMRFSEGAKLWKCALVIACTATAWLWIPWVSVLIYHTSTENVAAAERVRDRWQDLPPPPQARGPEHK